MNRSRKALLAVSLACVGCTSIDYFAANCIDYSARPQAWNTAPSWTR